MFVCMAFGLGVYFHMDVHGTGSGFLCTFVFLHGKGREGKEDS